MKVGVYAIAVACVLLGAGVSFALVGKSSGSASAADCQDWGNGGPWGGAAVVGNPHVVGTRFAVSASVRVPSWIGGGAGWVLVRRGKARTDPNNERSDIANNESQVVYKEGVRMMDLLPGDVPHACGSDWKWSGGLSTTDWAGGCASGDFYSVEVGQGDPTGYSSSDQTNWFTCRPSEG